MSIYSQTCSNDHLYKMNTCLRWPIPSLPLQIPMQSLLYKMTTCLMQPVITFVTQWKKTYLKQPLKNFTHRKNGKQTQGNNT